MTDARLAAVLTYIRRTWDNYGAPVEPAEVAEIRHRTAGRTTAWTVAELLDPSAAVAAPVDDPLEPYRGLLAGGDAERGRALFHGNRDIRCNACHVVGSSGGGFVGPELTAVGLRASAVQLLESIVEPSRVIAKGYETVVVETDDGRILSGTFVAEEDGQLVLAPPAGGRVSVALDEIAERSTAAVSSMPPMGQAFAPEQIADLVAYLVTLRGSEPRP
jgi:putative heme-binding domain-containing protein